MSTANTPATPAAFVPTPGYSPMLREDVADFFGCASVTFGQLGALLDVIANEAPEFSRLRKLAEMGKYVALDYENMVDTWRDQVEKGGVVS